MTSREVFKKLQAAGWIIRAQEGSHVHLKHPDRLGNVTVPHPRRDMPIGTLNSIERQSGMTLDRK